MKREEAMYLLNNLRSVAEGKEDEAIDMAIEALQADAVSLTGTMKYLTRPHNYCEVVRCKDCRWWQDNNNGYPHANCHWCETETPDEDDFCSLGERREP